MILTIETEFNIRDKVKIIGEDVERIILYILVADKGSIKYELSGTNGWFFDFQLEKICVCENNT